jgi:uncharacterized SAM-binding protein YcdF (DUF218 family)
MIEIGPHRLTTGPLAPTPPSPLRLAARRWGRLAAVAAAAILAVALCHRPLLEGYARLFRVDDPAPSDALVVLLGGPQCRPARAAELYRAGIAPEVILCTDGGSLPGMDRETAYTIRRMVEMGVPRGAIRVIPEVVTSTKEEAEAVLPVAVAGGMKRITVVTTAFHSARSRWIFRKVFRPSGIDVRAAAADDPKFDETNWYRHDESLLVYLNEMVKTVAYRLLY